MFGLFRQTQAFRKSNTPRSLPWKRPLKLISSPQNGSFGGTWALGVAAPTGTKPMGLVRSRIDAHVSLLEPGSGFASSNKMRLPREKETTSNVQIWGKCRPDLRADKLRRQGRVQAHWERPSCQLQGYSHQPWGGRFLLLAQPIYAAEPGAIFIEAFERFKTFLLEIEKLAGTPPPSLVSSLSISRFIRNTPLDSFSREKTATRKPFGIRPSCPPKTNSKRNCRRRSVSLVMRASGVSTR